MTKKSQRPVKKHLTHRQRSRLEKEARLKRYLTWGITIVSVAVVGLIAYGVIAEKVIKARQPMAVVNGTSIMVGEFQSRVRFTRQQISREAQSLLLRQQAMDSEDAGVFQEYIQQQVQDMQQQLDPENVQVIGQQVLDQMIEDTLVQQEAEQRGIVVSAAQLQRQIELAFGYDRSPVASLLAPTATAELTETEVVETTPVPSPTPMTEEGFQEVYNNFVSTALKPLNISERSFRSWFEVDLLRDALTEQLTAEVPETADQVKLNYLTLNDEARAAEVVARLDAGETFEALSDELNAVEEEGFDVYSSELSWYPQSILAEYYGADLAEMAFSLDVGAHSDVIVSESGEWYIVIEALGHEDQPLEEGLRETEGNNRYQAWLEGQMLTVERKSYDPAIVPTEP